MSRTVHLLKFWEDNQEFLKNVADKNKCVCWLKESGKTRHIEILEDYPRDSFHAILQCGKLFDRHYNEIANKFNSDNNITSKSDLYKGLTLPRLKILMALMAQQINFRIRPSYGHDLIFTSTPPRFIEKFSNLLVFGFWYLGSIIEDSLSHDPKVNCGNPFGFIPGDLGYWWAGVVMLDWLKYGRVTRLLVCKPIESCVNFYNDFNTKRALRYNQNCAAAHLERAPFQFLQGPDKLSFDSTITSIQSKQHCSSLLKRQKIDVEESINKVLKNIIKFDIVD